MATRCRSLATAALLTAGLFATQPAHAGSFTENFESDAVGSFPAVWGDVRLVALPHTPHPSALVVETTDAGGVPTHALQTVDAVSPSLGALQLIDSASQHTLSADVRVDRFGSSGPGITSWPLLFGVVQVLPGSDVCCFPTAQVGLFVSNATHGFRLYAIDGAGQASDIDLGASSPLGDWLHVDLGIDEVTGSVHSRVRDLQLGTVLLDRTDVIPDWSAADFDALAFFSGDLGGGQVAGIGSLDNVGYAAVPEPGTLALVGLGLAALSAARRRTR